MPCQTPCQTNDLSGTPVALIGTGFMPNRMDLGDNTAVRVTTGRNKETRVPEADIFPADTAPEADTFNDLDVTERKVLSEWVVRVSAKGIDAVKDLSVRPWNVAGAKVIVGVYETNKAAASWLVVRDGENWALARCADGFVSDGSASLPDILTQIVGDTNLC
jgi:hypothetical protein